MSSMPEMFCFQDYKELFKKDGWSCLPLNNCQIVVFVYKEYLRICQTLVLIKERTQYQGKISKLRKEVMVH